MPASSNSSRSDICSLSMLREWIALFGMRLQGIGQAPDFRYVFDPIAVYRRRLMDVSGLELERAKVFEIGYGQRPNRLRALMSMGVDVVGVDLDRPVLEGSISEFMEIGRRNGLQRLLKSAVRHFLFDGREQAALAAALRERGFAYRVERSRFLVGNVASQGIRDRIEPASVDLIYSEDVFEHLPEEDLEATVSRMREWLKPSAIALIRLTLYTGITGGHLTEWYQHTLQHATKRRSAPWEHLRQRRITANTYLNELRLADYLRIFSREFELLEVQKEDYGLGGVFLTPEVRADLCDYSEEELLTNEVRFVLRPHGRGLRRQSSPGAARPAA